MAAGIIDAASILDGETAVYPQSRSNVVHRLETRGQPVAFIKQRGVASVLDGDDAVANERHVLKLLSDLRCTPQLLAISDPDAVWVAAAAGVALTEVSDRTSGLQPACRAIARALVELHQHSIGLADGCPGASAPPAPTPWALHPEDLPPSMQGSPPGSACSLVLAVTTESNVRRALDLAASSWRSLTWTHGDLSAGNILVASATDGFGIEWWEATFIDFEGSGVGNPDWDLVTVVATVQNLGTTPEIGQAAADQLVTEYWRAGGPGKLNAALFTVRTVQTAWQLAAMTTSASATAVRQDPGPSAGIVNTGLEELLMTARGYAASALRGQGFLVEGNP